MPSLPHASHPFLSPSLQVTLPGIKKAVRELCEESYRFTGLGTVTPNKQGKVVCT